MDRLDQTEEAREPHEHAARRHGESIAKRNANHIDSRKLIKVLLRSPVRRSWSLENEGFR
jgi:hypothetical protein